MFEQSLVETSVETRRRKRWTAAVSYSLEASAVLVLLALPLIHTDALPLDDSPKIYAPTYRAPEHVQVTTAHELPHNSRRETAVINPLLPPQRIPTHIDMRPDPNPPQVSGGPSCVGCIPVPTGEDARNNPVLEGAMRMPPVVTPRHTAPVARTSKSQESLLIRKVTPTYPPIAIQARVQGAVVLHAIIGRDGSVQQLQVVTGPALLTRAAVQAVQQWHYRPYLLNGEPVEVETQITVNFALNQ